MVYRKEALLLSARFGVISDSYEEILENAFKKGLLKNSLYERLRGLGGFRNILAHGYLDLSDEEVFKNFRKLHGMLDEIIRDFEKLL